MSSAENAPGIDLSDAISPGHSRDGEAGFALAFEEGVERLAVTVEAAVEQGAGWGDCLAAGLGAGLDLLAADPPLARLLFVDVLAADRSARLARERSMERLAEALRPPAELTGGGPISDEILLLQAHGLVSYLSGRVLAGEVERLPEAKDALLQFLLAQIGVS